MTLHSQVPAIIGTNVNNLCKSFSSGSETDIPEQWKLAFDSLVHKIRRQTISHSGKLEPNSLKKQSLME